MFENIGWGEILILLVAALFILGPERLPEAAAWMGKSLRKVRDFATGARQQLKDEMGPEYEQFRKPLEDLRQFRSFDPKRAAIQHLFDGDQDPLGLDNINGTATNGNGAGGVGGTGGHANGSTKPNGYPAGTPQPEPLKPGEKPPVDPDAT